jgi:opacity protein-like surface antigen
MTIFRKVIAAAIVAAVLPMGASAQQVEIYHAGIGFASPSFEGAGDTWSTGLSGAAGVVYPVNEWIALRGDVGVNLFPLNDSYVLDATNAPEGASVSGGTTTAISGLVNVRLSAPIPVVRPYVFGGLGFVTFDVSDITLAFGGAENTVPMGSIDNALAWDVGAGAAMALGPYMTVFAEGLQVTTFGGDSYRPIRIGATLQIN